MNMSRSDQLFCTKTAMHYLIYHESSLMITEVANEEALHFCSNVFLKIEHILSDVFHGNGKEYEFILKNVNPFSLIIWFICTFLPNL